MNPIHIHLLFNHVPILGCMIGAILLITGYLTKKTDTITIAYWLLFAVSMVAIPVYSSGNLAERLISTLPGVTTEVTNAHEKSALFSFTALMFLGSIAGTIAALYRNREIPKLLTQAMIVFSFIVVWLMAGTGATGGEIRHTELREGHPDQQLTIEQAKKSGKNYKEMEKPHASRSGPIKNVTKLR